MAYVYQTKSEDGCNVFLHVKYCEAGEMSLKDIQQTAGLLDKKARKVAARVARLMDCPPCEISNMLIHPRENHSFEFHKRIKYFIPCTYEGDFSDDIKAICKIDNFVRLEN